MLVVTVVAMVGEGELLSLKGAGVVRLVAVVGKVELLSLKEAGVDLRLVARPLQEVRGVVVLVVVECWSVMLEVEVVPGFELEEPVAPGL